MTDTSKKGKGCALEAHINKGLTKHAALNEMQGAGKVRKPNRRGRQQKQKRQSL